MAYPCNFNVYSHIVAAPVSPVKSKVQEPPVLQLLWSVHQALVHSWLLSLSKGSIFCIKQVKVIKHQGPRSVHYSDVISPAPFLPPEVSTVVRLSGSSLSPVTTKSQMWAASNSNILSWFWPLLTNSLVLFGQCFVMASRHVKAFLTYTMVRNIYFLTSQWCSLGIGHRAFFWKKVALAQ